jgi:tRNA(fMet)-specific endonuclease VapC
VIILDTDVLSFVQRGTGREYETLAERLDSLDEDVAVSIVSFEEQMRGWLAFIARTRSSVQETGAYAKLYAFWRVLVPALFSILTRLRGGV